MDAYIIAEALTDKVDTLLYERDSIDQLEADDDKASRLYGKRIDKALPPYVVELNGQKIRVEASEILETFRRSIFHHYLQQCRVKDICELDKKIHAITGKLFSFLVDEELSFIPSYVFLRQMRCLPPGHYVDDGTFEIFYVPEPMYKDHIGMDVFQWYVHYRRKSDDYGVCLTFHHNVILTDRQIKIKVLSAIAKARTDNRQ